MSSVEAAVTGLENDAYDDGSDKRQCWVCFASEDDDRTALWVQPCRCKGTTKWVHQGCIQRWIDEKQKGNALTKVSCPQCNTEYIVVFPNLGVLVQFMDSADRMVYKLCPFVAAGIVVGSIYWSAVTYGAVTVMQVLGHKEGLTVMEQADPLFLLVGLPTIPIMLILAKMVRWEDYVVRMWRKNSSRIPLIHHVFPSYNMYNEQDNMDNGLALPEYSAPLADPVSATRVLCGALMLPTVSTLFGKLMFQSVESNLQRALMGGLAFIAIKGVLKIYYKNKQLIRQSQRKILDFKEQPAPFVNETVAEDAQN